MDFRYHPHLLRNFEIQKYYPNELRFNGVYSRDDLSDKIKDGAYVIMHIKLKKNNLKNNRKIKMIKTKRKKRTKT